MSVENDELPYKIANRKFNEELSNVLKILNKRRDVLRERYRETKLEDESLRIISQLDELNWAIFLLVERKARADYVPDDDTQEGNATEIFFREI
jgi:hypothetical protein